MPRRDARRGLDPYERAVLGAGRAPATEAEATSAGEKDKSAPPPLPRRATIGNLRVGSVGLLAFLGVLVAVAVLRGGSPGRALLEPSCTQPRVAVALARIEQFQPLTFTVAGADGRYRVALRAAGARGAQQQLVAAALEVRGCRATSVFGVQTSPGRHVLEVRRLPVGGCAQPDCADAELSATTPLEVLPER